MFVLAVSAGMGVNGTARCCNGVGGEQWSVYHWVDIARNELLMGVSFGRLFSWCYVIYRLQQRHENMHI